jgi:translation initiation factor IF-3
LSAVVLVGLTLHSSQPQRNTAIVRPTRPSRPYEAFHRGPAINDRIRANPVRLIDQNDKMVGVVETIEALRQAFAAGLDLVEVSPEAEPPVCKILDFGKYKYELAKKEKANKAKTKTAELKEVRLGRSMKIDPHDVEIRLQQARRFLMEGHKVQIVQNFKGREMQHRDRGDQRMKLIVEKLSDISKVEIPPRMAGRRMSMMLSPDKAKVDAILRRTKSAAKETAASAGSSPVAPQVVAENAATMPATDGQAHSGKTTAESASTPAKPRAKKSQPAEANAR